MKPEPWLRRMRIIIEYLDKVRGDEDVPRELRLGAHAALQVMDEAGDEYMEQATRVVH